MDDNNTASAQTAPEAAQPSASQSQPLSSAAIARSSRPKGWYADAFGPGLVLVVLPGFALFFGLTWLTRNPAIGLPVVAIFGIMILLGALALVSTLFQRLGLDDDKEALGLPPGSIRAFIALSLIVLFALISIMLFESLGETIQVPGLTADAKNNMLKEPINHVSAVVENPCPPGSASTCTSTYTLYLQKSRGPESENLSKQLLILIGTLMTSVVSFYFASRSGEAQTKSIIAALNNVAPNAPMAAPKPSDAVTPRTDNTGDTDSTLDGCQGPVGDPTDDKDLPQSKGGVAP